MNADIKIRLREKDFTISGPEMVLRAIGGELSVFHPKYHALKSRRPKWDGYVKFFKGDPESGFITCKLGLMDRVLKVLKHIEADYTVDDSLLRSIPPVVHEHWVEGIKLDPLQEQVCQMLAQERVAVVELGTSSGKTEIIANSAANFLYAYSKGIRVMVVVPSRSLLHQTKDRIISRLPKLAESVGILGDGQVFTKHHEIVVTTFQSAGKDTEHAERLRRTTGLIIIDEGHHSISPTIRKIIDETPWDRLWAVSGKVSFFSDDDVLKQWELRELLGPPIFTGSVKERQCPTEVIIHTVPSWQGHFRGQKLAGSISDGVEVLFRMNDQEEWKDAVYLGEDTKGVPNPLFVTYNDKKQKYEINRKLYGIYYDGKLVKPPGLHLVYHTATDIAGMEFRDRNTWALKLAKQFQDAGEPYLITTLRPRHAYKLFRRAEKMGIKALVVTGDKSGTDQQKALNALSDGKVPGVFAVYSTVSEGLDIPRLRHLIKLDMVTSEQVLEQTLGRLRRKFEGKTVGSLHLPWDHQQSNLLRKSQKALLYYERSGVTIKRVID